MIDRQFQLRVLPVWVHGQPLPFSAEVGSKPRRWTCDGVFLDSKITSASASPATLFTVLAHVQGQSLSQRRQLMGKLGKLVTVILLSFFFFCALVHLLLLIFFCVCINSIHNLFHAADSWLYPGLSLPSSSGFVLGACLHQDFSSQDVAHCIGTVSFGAVSQNHQSNQWHEKIDLLAIADLILFICALIQPTANNSNSPNWRIVIILLVAHISNS